MIRVSINGFLYELVVVGNQFYTWDEIGYADDILMEEYLREELEKGVKAYKEKQQSMPKGYTVRFPGREAIKK